MSVKRIESGKVLLEEITSFLGGRGNVSPIETLKDSPVSLLEDEVITIEMGFHTFKILQSVPTHEGATADEYRTVLLLIDYPGMGCFWSAVDMPTFGNDKVAYQAYLGQAIAMGMTIWPHENHGSEGCTNTDIHSASVEVVDNIKTWDD